MWLRSSAHQIPKKQRAGAFSCSREPFSAGTGVAAAPWSVSFDSLSDTVRSVHPLWFQARFLFWFFGICPSLHEKHLIFSGTSTARLRFKSVIKDFPELPKSQNAINTEGMKRPWMVGDGQYSFTFENWLEIGNYSPLSRLIERARELV